MSRKTRTRVVAGVLLAGVVGVLLWYVLVPKERFVYGLTPISRNEVVLLTRWNADDDPSRFWVELVRDDGSHAWSAELTPFQVNDVADYTGVVATEDRIVLSVSGARGAAVTAMALDRATGKTLWRTEVSASEDPSIGPRLILDGSRVYVMHGRPAGDRIESSMTALSISDGAVLWSLPKSEETRKTWVEPVLLEPGRIVLVWPGERALEVDGETGTVRGPLPIYWSGCETPGGFVGHASARVVVVPPSDTETKSGMTHVDLREQRGAASGPCGMRGADIVVGVTGDSVKRIGLARFDARDGTMRWNLSFDGERMFVGSVASVAGTLPRFMPIAVARVDEEGDPRSVVVVDLDEGKIVAEHDVDHHVVTVVNAERAYVMSALLDPFLASLDPATGELAKLTRIVGVTTGDDVPREDLRFGRLWFGASAWGRPSELGWAALDLDSGEIAVHGSVRKADFTSEGWAAIR